MQRPLRLEWENRAVGQQISNVIQAFGAKETQEPALSKMHQELASNFNLCARQYLCRSAAAMARIMEMIVNGREKLRRITMDSAKDNKCVPKSMRQFLRSRSDAIRHPRTPLQYGNRNMNAKLLAGIILFASCISAAEANDT